MLINQEFKLKSIKDNLIKGELNGNEKYIEPEKIIYEETKEDKRASIENENKRYSYSSLNKVTFSKNASKKSSNKIPKKHLSIDALMEDNFYRNKLFNMFLKNNEYINSNKKNQINNFLNITVNINFRCHKYNRSSSSLEDEDDFESKDEQVNIEFDGNNQIIESSIQSNEDIEDKNKD